MFDDKTDNILAGVIVGCLFLGAVLEVYFILNHIHRKEVTYDI